MSEVKVKWPKVLDYNDIDQPPLIEWIDLGNGTMFRIFAFFSRGGTKRPRPGLVVALERVGSFFFKLGGNISYQYVSEKLNVPEPDARALADWLNIQLDQDVPQQGEYNEKYINEVELYFYSGEVGMMPLVPEIIQ